MSVPAFKSLASIIFTNCNYFIETIELFSGYWFVIIIFFFLAHTHSTLPTRHFATPHPEIQMVLNMVRL